MRLHKSSETSKKRPKGGVLSATERMENRRISRERVFVENIISRFKVLKIVAHKYHITGVNASDYVHL